MDRRGNLLRLYNNDFSIKLIALPLGRNSTHTIQNNKMNHLKCGKTLFLTGRIVFDKPNFVYIEEK